LRYPKLRELKEAVHAVFSPRFTTRFPAEPCEVPEKYRGKPEFDLDKCIGCGACVNVCPTLALTQKDDIDADPSKRTITLRYDTCIFCGNCSDTCTTLDGINLSNQWDLATMDRESTVEHHDFELQVCEKCGEIIGTKKHLIWLYEKLGPMAYTNPSLLLANQACLTTKPQVPEKSPETKEKLLPSNDVQPSDFMRILCPKCKCQVNIRL